MFFCCCNNCLIFSDNFSDAAVSLGPEPVYFPTPVPGSGNFHEYPSSSHNWSVSGGKLQTSTAGTTAGGSPNYLFWDNSNYVVRQCWYLEADVAVTGGYGMIGQWSFTPSYIYNGTPGAGEWRRRCSWSGSATITKTDGLTETVYDCRIHGDYPAGTMIQAHEAIVAAGHQHGAVYWAKRFFVAGSVG